MLHNTFISVFLLFNNKFLDSLFIAPTRRLLASRGNNSNSAGYCVRLLGVVIRKLVLPVPFMPEGRMRASYLPGPRIWSSICFSFSRKLIFAFIHLLNKKNHVMLCTFSTKRRILYFTILPS